MCTPDPQTRICRFRARTGTAARPFFRFPTLGSIEPHLTTAQCTPQCAGGAHRGGRANLSSRAARNTATQHARMHAVGWETLNHRCTGGTAAAREGVWAWCRPHTPAKQQEQCSWDADRRAAQNAEVVGGGERNKQKQTNKANGRTDRPEKRTRKSAGMENGKPTHTHPHTTATVANTHIQQDSRTSGVSGF